MDWIIDIISIKESDSDFKIGLGTVYKTIVKFCLGCNLIII